jgi:mono/diheme cytochrome c family protein
VNAVAGPLPDLRYADKDTLEGIEGIVLGGSRASLGMPSFAKILTPAQVQGIKAYIVTRARESAKTAVKQK